MLDGWTGRTYEGVIGGNPRFRDPMIDECHGYTVYGHLTPSMKWYFGITRNHPERRWGHNGIGYKGSYFYNAIKKYGWNNIFHHIVGTGLTKEEACFIERELIAKYDTMNRERGYNRTIGGDTGILGYRFSNEQRQHLSQVHKGKKCSHGYAKGHVPWNKGGGYYSPESRKRMSDASKGRRISEETRKKLSIAHSGKRHWNYGNHYSEEFKKRLSESHKGLPNANKKPVWCIETGQFFFSAKEAAAFLGLQSDAVARVCRGERGTAGGLHFAYMNEPYRRVEKRPRSKQVQCVETGEVFSSAVLAARKYKVTDGAINTAARNPKKTSCGYHWRYLTIDECSKKGKPAVRKRAMHKKPQKRKQAKGQMALSL